MSTITIWGMPQVIIWRLRLCAPHATVDGLLIGANGGGGVSDRTSIEWTATVHADGSTTPGATWNPVVPSQPPDRWVCQKISPGCDNCYASALNVRFGGSEYAQAGRAPFPPVKLSATQLPSPRGWRRARRIFVCSTTDLFGEWVTVELQAEVFRVMAETPHHTYLCLTKRPKAMGARLPMILEMATGTAATLPNVWLGVSVESDAYTWRADVLAKIPAAVRFVSAEPLLGPLPSLQLSVPCRSCRDCNCAGRGGMRPAIDWLIIGGESGGPADRRLIEPCTAGVSGRYLGGHRYVGESPDCPSCYGSKWQIKPESLEWVRDLRDRAVAAGVKLHFKQWGGPSHGSRGRVLDGRLWEESP